MSAINDLKFMVRVLMGKADAPDHSKRDNVERALEEIRENGGWDHLLDIVRFRGFRASLVEERIAKGISLSVMAARMGVSEHALTEFETDFLPNPTVTFLQRYAFELGWQIVMNAVERVEGP